MSNITVKRGAYKYKRIKRQYQDIVNNLTNKFEGLD